MPLPLIWEAISGASSKHESPLAAVEREIAEECGLQVRIDPRPLSAHQSVRAGIPMIIVYYLADHVSGEVRLSDEHEDFAWLDAEEFAARTPIAPLAQAVREALG
jgi:8-oxo-dGTP diphosphatase